MSQFSVLQALHTEGSMYQIALARHIGKTTGNLTTVIDNLEKRGLVRRVREQRDRRYYKVEPTPEGRKLIRKAYPAHVRQVERVMGKLTAGEQDMLSTLCTRLHETEDEK
ncbi:MAG: MarR family transcriptional regulator [Desulfobulbaceae bacterium]|jgi:MarR family 2-MHQ and catechol resistance regulon transcriptional repressor|nr:MarR family transcriptional regulator [Desulfobulbaceae bacterium]MDY0350586.1 MarR family transcriptional regulator [Desulfobulbaceae bacterium]